MPEQLYKLTPFELDSLYWHKIREDRRQKYNLFLNAWWPNHKEGTTAPTEEKFMPLPGDPGYKPLRKEPTVEDCVEMMRRVGEGGPPG